MHLSYLLIGDVFAVAHFTTHPLEYFSGEQRHGAIAALNDYRGKTGFHFDRLIRDTDPNRITPQDIVAVSMLSVDIPARVSIWLLDGEGADIVNGRLKDIDPKARIWDEGVELHDKSPAWALWNDIADRTGMGPTTTSKLLAAKRPHLLPVIDDVVRVALFAEQRKAAVERTYWDLWRDELRGHDGEKLRAAVEEVRADAGYENTTSILRIIDIVVWNVNRG